MKHAFPDGRPGNIEISMRRADPGSVELAVADDGVGLPVDLEALRSSTLGLRLVDGFAAKLKGEVIVQQEGGTRFQICFSEKGTLPESETPA